MLLLLILVLVLVFLLLLLLLGLVDLSEREGRGGRWLKRLALSGQRGCVRGWAVLSSRAVSQACGLQQALYVALARRVRLE